MFPCSQGKHPTPQSHDCTKRAGGQRNPGTGARGGSLLLCPFPTFQPLEWALQAPFIKKGHLLPSLAPPLSQCTAWVRAGGRASPGSKTEVGSKDSAFEHQNVPHERCTGCMLMAQCEGGPRGHFPGQPCQTQARVTSTPAVILPLTPAPLQPAPCSLFWKPFHTINKGP